MADELVKKIVKAALDVGGKLKADKKNKDQNYDYLSADKILAECGQALFNQGIAVLPEITSQEVTGGTTASGKQRFDCRVDFSFSISDGETVIERKWYGMGSDYSVPDKAMYKAITSGHKYFLMKLLCIGEGNEDSEHEGEGEKKASRQVDKATGEIRQPVPVAPPAPSNNGHAAEATPETTLAEQRKAKWPADAKVSWEMASTITGHDGQRYVDLPREKMGFMIRSMDKRLDDNSVTDEQRAEVQLKRDTASILATL
jgi:hypothetical protein